MSEHRGHAAQESLGVARKIGARRGFLAAAASLVAVVAFSGRASGQPVDFSLRVSPQSGTIDDEYVVTVQSTIRGVAGADRFWPPDLGEFEVRDQRAHPSTQWYPDPVRGQEIRNVEVRQYRVKAKRFGKLKIGPARLRLDGRDYETSEAMVEVTAAGGAGATAGTPPAPGASSWTATVPGYQPPDPSEASQTFVHVVVDRTRAVVGEQITVTWLLFTRSDILKFEPRIPAFDGFFVETLYEAKNYFDYHEEEVGGRAYAVAVVAKRALFPTRAGKLVIPAHEADVATLFTSFATPLSLKSRAVPIEVDALPAAVPPGFDPAYVGSFSVAAVVDRTTVQAGDSLTLTLIVRGAGAIRRAPIPTLTLDGFRVYPPRDFEEKVDATTGLVRGERRYRYLLTPLRGGTLGVGPITIPFFDPGTGRFDTARTTPLSITVVGDPAAAGAIGPADKNVIGRDIRPIQEPPGLVASTWAHIHEQGWFRGLLALPLAVFMLVLLGDRLRERLSRDTPRARLRRARGRARRRLRAADLHIRGGRAARFFAEIATALNEHIEDRVSRPVSAMTRDQLREFLPTRGFSRETVEALVRELDNCDFARFAPAASGPGEMRAALRRVQALLKAIERVRPVAANREAA